jgi:hypothetical protein
MKERTRTRETARKKQESKVEKRKKITRTEDEGKRI